LGCSYRIFLEGFKTSQGDGRAYVYLPHEGRVRVMEVEELARKDWGPGGKEVVLIAPELGGVPITTRKDIKELQKRGERLVLIYNPYENRYEVMTEGYFRRSRDIGDQVLTAYSLRGGR